MESLFGILQHCFEDMAKKNARPAETLNFVVDGEAPKPLVAEATGTNELWIDEGIGDDFLEDALGEVNDDEIKKTVKANSATILAGIGKAMNRSGHRKVSSTFMKPAKGEGKGSTA